MDKQKFEVQMIHSDGRDEEIEVIGRTFNIAQECQVYDLTEDEVNTLRATNRFEISPYTQPVKKAKKGKKSPPQEDE